MPALLTSTSIGPSLGDDFLDALGAGLEGRDIPLEHRNAGLRLELLRGLVVAAVIGRDLIAGRLQRLGDRRANPAGAAGNQRNARHDAVPSQGFSLLVINGTSRR